MTTKLTHEQACQLRMIPVFMPDYIDAKIREALRWAYDADEPLIELGWRSDESSIWQLSDAGREALAEYDREWVTVRRIDLEDALDSLEYHLDDMERNFPDQKELYDARVSTANTIRAALEEK